jgi:predicted nuclease of predicted toxin-antitoxin system
VSRPRFLADEDLRFEMVLAVRRREPAVEFATVQENGKSGATDAEVLEYANANGLIVVSHDVNTLRAEAEQRVGDGRGVGGVLLTAQRNPTRNVADSLVMIWSASEAEEWRNRVVFIPL